MGTDITGEYLYFIKPILKVIRWLHKKGLSHFTLMFIPYSQRKVVSFQISNYAVIMVFLLFGFAIFSLYNYSVTREKLIHDLKEIERKDKVYWNFHRRISKRIQQDQTQLINLKKELNSIYRIIADKSYLVWSDVGLDDIYELDDLKLKEKQDLKNAGIKNIHNIKKTEHFFYQADKRLKEIQNLLAVRNNIKDNLPTMWPVFQDKGYKTSGFGKRFSPFESKYKFHIGVDIASSPNTPIVSTADGVVVFAGTKKGYGNTLIIKHKYGYKTLYGHNSKLLVQLHQKVKKGQKIGLLGKTGRSTGYHVHYEIHVDNVPVDPWLFLTVEI